MTDFAPDDLPIDGGPIDKGPPAPEALTQRVTDEKARILCDGDYEPVVQIGIGTTINIADLAADLLDARKERDDLRAKLDKVCEAGA